MTSNPEPARSSRISRAILEQEIAVSDLGPVDTSNSNIPGTLLGKLPATDPLTKLPNRKKRTPPTKAGRRKFSYKLRYIFKALLHWESERPNFVIAFATVHFDSLTETKLTKAKKGPVSAYGDRLSKALATIDSEISFFFTLEKGKTLNKRLHAHILIAYHPDNLLALKEVLKRGANTTGTGLRIQHTYILKHPARPGSFEYEALELDQEYGICCYEQDDDGNFYRELPVDIGAVDYMSKDLAKRSFNKGRQNYYAPQPLKRLANELWDIAYRKQADLKARVLKFIT